MSDNTTQKIGKVTRETLRELKVFGPRDKYRDGETNVFKITV